MMCLKSLPLKNSSTGKSSRFMLSWKSKSARFLKTAGTLGITAFLLLTVIPAAPAKADDPPVKLQLSGAGAINWNISNITPGTIGTKILSVRNVGTKTGALHIWISNIVDTAGTTAASVPVNAGESNRLSDHLRFRTVSGRQSTNVIMPATLAGFPQSANGTTKVTLSPIASNETIDLTWEWYIPATAGNAIQGSSVSFDINYTLQEMPVVPAGGNPPGGGLGGGGGGGGGGSTTVTTVVSSTPVPTNSGQQEYFIKISTPVEDIALIVTREGYVTETQTVPLFDNVITLVFDRGTRILTETNKIPDEIRVVLREDSLIVPPDMEIIGKVYRIQGYLKKTPQPIILSQPVRVVLNYNPSEITPDMSALFVATYDDSFYWTQLPLDYLIPEKGAIYTSLNNFTTFALLVKIKFAGQVTPPPDQQLPARFELSNLTLSSKQVKAGEFIAINVDVKNTGELSGEHNLMLKVNELFIESKYVKLAPGENSTVSFSILTYVPGVYELGIDTLRESFTVTEGPVPKVGRTTDIWPVPGVPLILGAIVFIILLKIAPAGLKKLKLPIRKK